MKWILLTALIFSCSLTTFGQQESFKSVIEKARHGDANAQNEAGYRYHEGVGVTRNLKTAVYWYRKSAEQANVHGACNLGLSYGMRHGVGKDLTLAMKWLFIGTVLGAIKCHFSDYVPSVLRPEQHEVNEGHKLAVAWLRARPHLKDGFGEQRWMEPSFDEPPQIDMPCSQSAAEQTNLMDEAQRNQFTVRRVEFLGLTHTPDSLVRGRMTPLMNEGDLFTRARLLRSLRQMSTLKPIYPVRLKDVEFRLARSDRLVDMAICFTERPR